jgi:hypothetical protein
MNGRQILRSKAAKRVLKKLAMANHPKNESRLANRL